MKKKVYFAGSIRGGRQDALVYKRIIDFIKKDNIVLTEHIGKLSYGLEESSKKSDRDIYDQDMAWLEESDLVIAECSQPSLGVGYEMAYAEKIGKPVYIFCRQGISLSAMLAGNPYFSIYYYENEEEIFERLEEILNKE